MKRWFRLDKESSRTNLVDEPGQGQVPELAQPNHTRNQARQQLDRDLFDFRLGGCGEAVAKDDSDLVDLDDGVAEEEGVEEDEAKDLDDVPALDGVERHEEEEAVGEAKDRQVDG